MIMFQTVIQGDDDEEEENDDDERSFKVYF